MDLRPNSVLEECDSTNDLVRALGNAGHPHGTWISARRQLAGRGRLGRKWESLEGNLFLSMIYRSTEERRDWSWVPLTAAIGAAQALRALDPGLDVRIKWPNDLWISSGIPGAKLGGILCEAVGSRQGSFIIVGMGLNCAFAPEGLDQPTTSLSAALGGARITAEEVRAPVIAGLREAFAELQERGSGGIRRRYDEWAAFPEGTEIEWGDPAQPQRARVKGLGESSELLAESIESLGEKPGELLRLYAEDVKIRVARTASGESLP